MQTIRTRLLSGVETVELPFGPVAFASGAAGAPVLAIHGAGGGHDQGRLLAEAFLPEGYRWIAPSRFGYPGSALPADPSTTAQADAFAAMRGGFGINRVTVRAMSGGVPPALQFALAPLRHRLRVDAQFAAQLRERSLRSLYCSSDGVRGRGAPVTNLSNSASVHSCERIEPSNRGTKHPATAQDPAR